MQGRIVISHCQKFREGTETGMELQWPACLWLIKTEYIKPNNTDKIQWTRSLKMLVNLMSSPQGCWRNFSPYLGSLIGSVAQPPRHAVEHPLNLINLHKYPGRVYVCCQGGTPGCWCSCLSRQHACKCAAWTNTTLCLERKSPEGSIPHLSKIVRAPGRFHMGTITGSSLL